MQHAGSGLKLPCKRTFKLKTAKTSAAIGGYSNGGASSSGRLEYIWLPNESDDAVFVGLYQATRFYAVHADHLATPRLFTNDTIQPAWQRPYASFGDN